MKPLVTPRINKVKVDKKICGDEESAVQMDELHFFTLQEVVLVTELHFYL